MTNLTLSTREWLAVVLLVGSTVGVVAGASGHAVGNEASLELQTTVQDGSSADRATIAITLRNVGETTSVAPVVRLESLPEGYTVVNQTSDAGTYRDSTREWLWLALEPGETAEATVTVETEGTGGTFEIPVVAEDEAGNAASATVTGSVGAAGGSSDDTTLVLGVVGAVLAVLAWRRYGGA